MKKLYTQPAALRLAFYSLTGFVCTALVITGIIDQSQSDTVMNTAAPIIGMIVSALAAFNVNVHRPGWVEPQLPSDGSSVGAFQLPSGSRCP